MESIKDKIRKLLAVAECASASEAEKATALHQAARLAQKYAIDMDLLGDDASDFGSTELCCFASKPAWLDGVLMVVCEHFNVRAYNSRMTLVTGVNEIRWFAFGCAASREVAVYVFTFLRREFLAIARQMRVPSRRRLGFFRSLASGLLDKLKALENAASEPAVLRDGLILSKKLDAEFEAVSSGFGVARVRPVVGSREAYQRGKEIEINPALRGAGAKRLSHSG